MQEQIRIFLERNGIVGHNISEDGIKLNKEKTDAIDRLKSSENPKQLKNILGALQYLAKLIPKVSERMENLRKLLQKRYIMDWN